MVKGRQAGLRGRTPGALGPVILPADHYKLSMVNPAEHLGLVYAIANKRARRYGGRFAVEDLIQEGAIGLMHAIRRYDPARGAFSTCASWSVHGEIDAYIVEKGGRLVQLPVKVARQLNKEAALPPAPTEFFDNEHQSETESPADLYEKAETAEIVWAAVEKLGAKKAKLIQLYFRDGLDMTQIGRELGLSRQRVHDKLSRALAALRQYLAKRLDK